MKHSLLSCMLMLFSILAFSQKSVNTDALYLEGVNFLKGTSRPYNPDMAKRLFIKAANFSDSRAMLMLGKIYSIKEPDFFNSDSSLYWYKKAAGKGEVKANYILGRIYQTGDGVVQNFSTAVKFYQKAYSRGDKLSKNTLAYLYYKGLGLKQNYAAAFNLFKASAEGDSIRNSMYFLGLCYKNGYGVQADQPKAQYWLKKAAEDGETTALHELLEEPMPENKSLVSAELTNKLASIQGNVEKFEADNTNNYEGVFEGYAIYYDWSGKFVTEILPLKLDLKRTMDGYAGKWEENNSDPAAILMTSFANKFIFSNASKYLRNNRYSGGMDELWFFGDAKLNLSFINDSIQLNGYVQFYSPKRKEPGKPMQIILKRAMPNKIVQKPQPVKFQLYPNPANLKTTLQFQIKETSVISIQVHTQTGKLVFVENTKKLPAGDYSLPISLQNLAAGTYTVTLITNNQKETKILIKQ